MKPVALGQHFLKNEDILRRLVEQTPASSDEVLEIGAGDGRLTERLLRAGYHVTSYELDRRLYEETKAHLGSYRNLRLVLGDGFTDENRFDVLVASLPYYASRRFVEWFASVTTPLGVVVLQKDFADKITSEPGTRKYGAYSILTSCCFLTKKLFVIPPGDFEPRPKVYSCALRMERIRTVVDAGLVGKKLKALFGYRGRLLASFVRDNKKRRLWNESIQIEGGLLNRRVEDLSPSEAMWIVDRMNWDG
jgi:16S rRNA (adenine1518-N6/adenine1519-N6)-dimethyltransferase